MCCECKDKYRYEPDLAEAPMWVLISMLMICGAAGLFFIGMLIRLIVILIFHV